MIPMIMSMSEAAMKKAFIIRTSLQPAQQQIGYV
jgi:hypothetical protein